MATLNAVSEGEGIALRRIVMRDGELRWVSRGSMSERK